MESLWLYQYSGACSVRERQNKTANVQESKLAGGTVKETTHLILGAGASGEVGVVARPLAARPPEDRILRAQKDLFHSVALVVASDVGKKVAVARDVPMGAVSYA